MSTQRYSKWANIGLLIAVEIGAMTLWFVSAAISGDMAREVAMSSASQAALSSAVQAGFVVGALISAVLGIADRFQPRHVLAICAVCAAAANFLLLVAPIGGMIAIGLRAITGICLAGVYPVGMKIAVGWGRSDRGLLVGLLVGGLTLGSAAPHLLSFLGGADWRSIVVATSLIAALSALLVLKTENGPYHATASRFDASVITEAWTNKKVRKAYGGYLGHMWELYAMWAWIGFALALSFSQQLPETEAAHLAKLVTFVVIGSGAISSAAAGWVADRIGKAELAIAAMAMSGTCALLFGLTFGGAVWLTILISFLWGISVIPDSAQFSALVADYAPADKVGSLMTFQTALGFALTTLTVQAAPVIADLVGWSVLMASLALGPMLGIYWMLGLRK
ncbi:MFS transporter [Chromatiales bacterium (ex Bugula neritina AB1)]|nr:MFS transporter [Chromatiales bacterium (ex Bugula neritina AB1)]